MTRFWGMWIILLSVLTLSAAENPDSLFEIQLQYVTNLWATISPMHPAWEKLYPVCIASGDDFRLYQPEADGSWKLTTTVHRPGQVPRSIRAAYPLDLAGNQIVCVIDPSVLATPQQRIILFHEFVHCYQFNTCESAIKDTLLVCRTEMAKQNWMWEINHNFPYHNHQVMKTYLAMIKAANHGDATKVKLLRGQLKSMLSQQDWEYLTWQEFKEGTARYLENELNATFGYPLSHSSHHKPFDRVIFYEGGEKLIRLVTITHPELPKDLPALWKTMQDFETKSTF